MRGVFLPAGGRRTLAGTFPRPALLPGSFGASPCGFVDKGQRRLGRVLSLPYRRSRLTSSKTFSVLEVSTMSPNTSRPCVRSRHQSEGHWGVSVLRRSKGSEAAAGIRGEGGLVPANLTPTAT